MGLTYKIEEAMQLQREEESLRVGVSPYDIKISRLSGIDPRDVRTFTRVSKNGLIIIVRCPNPLARGWHGLIPPKGWAMKEKTSPKSGTWGPDQHKKEKGPLLVSDYDLMSVWRQGDKGWKKVFISAANGASRGPYPKEGAGILRELNKHLVSRIQHGCQDDFCSVGNPGVKPMDHFAAFHNGRSEHLQNSITCKLFYNRYKLLWLYNDSGKYLLDLAKQQSAKK